jgi:DNA-binding MurR/RpiR family transcriptional regulator
MPMIVEQLFGKKKLTESEKQIIDFIESNPRIVVNLSLEELSEKCFVSQASVIRLCKKLGTRGFADFKIRLASALNEFLLSHQDIHVDVPISPDADGRTIAETFYNLSSQALQTTFAGLDYNLLGRAARMIARSDMVHIYGRGESLILAEDFHYKMIRIGRQSSLETLNGFQEARCLRSGDRLRQVALLISHYCNSRQVHYIVDELMGSRIPFILVTAAEKAWPYENLAAVTLRVTSSESRFKMGSFYSRTAMLYLLDCLYGQIFSLDYEQNKNNLTLFSQRKVERSYFYNADTP